MLLLGISMYAVYGKDCNNVNPLDSLNIASNIIEQITNCLGENYWSDEFPRRSVDLFQALIEAKDVSQVNAALLPIAFAGLNSAYSEYPAFQSSVSDLVTQIDCLNSQN